MCNSTGHLIRGIQWAHAINSNSYVTSCLYPVLFIGDAQYVTMYVATMLIYTCDSMSAHDICTVNVHIISRLTLGNVSGLSYHAYILLYM